MPRGASRQDVEAAFRAWDVLDEELLDVTDAPGWVGKREPRVLQLRRK